MKLRLLIILCASVCIGAMGRTFSEIQKNNCQMVDSVARTVTLIFANDGKRFDLPQDSIKSVHVYGSVSEWNEKKKGYRLDSISEDGCYYRTFTYDQVEYPHHSGQPEFMFYVQMKDGKTEHYLHPKESGEWGIDPRLLFVNTDTTILIVYPDGPYYFTTDTDELYARRTEAEKIRSLDDFDLTTPEDQYQISNFRLTPGTNFLYRSYHPYCPDKPQYDTEAARLHWVAELAEQVKIKSDITLCENYENRVGEKYACGGDSFIISIPAYYQSLMDKGNILYVGMQYGGHATAVQCYYHSDEIWFARWMKEVVEFIADERHPLPIQIHCSLGADRTGMFCATIAAMCGVDWQTIIQDYQETGNMKNQTYRHPNCLRYAFNRMTGLNPDSVTSAELSQAVRRHFVDMGVLTEVQIDRMVYRLTIPSGTAMEMVMETSTSSSQTFDLLGRMVDKEYHGLVVTQGEKHIQ